MPVAAPHTPIVLSSEVTVNSGASVGLRSEALRNPFDVPIEIMEIRFHAIQSRTITLPAGTLGPRVAGNAIQVDMALGKFKITNALVPVWNFGRSELPMAEITTDQAYSPLTPADMVFNQYEWKLARPLVIPPHQGLSIKAVSTGLVLDPVQVRVSCFARVINRKIQSKDPVYIPWVAPWITKQFFVGQADVSSSTETDLITPVSYPMNLHWFTARMAVWNPGVANTTDYGQNDDVSHPTMAYNLTQVRMRDSRGYPVIRDYTYWGTAWNQLTRSWSMDGKGFQVPANMYWLADIAVATKASAPAYQAQASIAVVGSYEVPYGDIA